MNQVFFIGHFNDGAQLKGSCLRQENKATFTQKNVVTFFIIYELHLWPQDTNTDFALEGCLFGGF